MKNQILLGKERAGNVEMGLDDSNQIMFNSIKTFFQELLAKEGKSPLLISNLMLKETQIRAHLYVKGNQSIFLFEIINGDKVKYAVWRTVGKIGVVRDREALNFDIEDREDEEFLDVDDRKGITGESLSAEEIVERLLGSS